MKLLKNFGNLMGERRLNLNFLYAITSKGNPLERIQVGPCSLLSGGNADTAGPREVNTSGGKGKPAVACSRHGPRLWIEGGFLP